ncbi:hypothetical protein GCM10023323_62010 [Streptomyces thinghirensis]|uniref:Uncharacterized protein n=1 Tax=Streptomyces thinghirensis TaxID=551547 RepID=A0ABP9TE04_9ACTN
MRPVADICSTLLHESFTLGSLVFRNAQGDPQAIPRGEAAAVPPHRLGVDPAWDRGIHTGGRNGCRADHPSTRYACPVSNRAIRPSSSTVKSHRVRISPQVSLL